MTWWLLPTDLESKAWASVHKGDIVTGCWLAPAKQLTPVSGIRL